MTNGTIQSVTAGGKREAMLRDLSGGMTAKEAALKYRMTVDYVRSTRRGERPLKDGTNRPQPAKSHDMVMWRHKFIMEMRVAGHGCSFIGAVLRLDHTSIIHHTSGGCKCVV